MAFWNEASLDPKRQYKFKVSFGLLGQDAQFLAQSADRPTYTISDNTKVDFLDKAFHFPGKISWNPVKVKFVDAAGGTNVSQRAYTYLSTAGWINPANQNVNQGGSAANFSTISKARAITSNSVIIEVLDSNGIVVDNWTLNNAFITTVALNNLDYSAEAILTAEFTFRYDWATLGQ